MHDLQEVSRFRLYCSFTCEPTLLKWKSSKIMTTFTNHRKNLLAKTSSQVDIQQQLRAKNKPFLQIQTCELETEAGPGPE